MQASPNRPGHRRGARASTRAAIAVASRPKTSVAVLAAAFLLLSLALASGAGASVYWTNTVGPVFGLPGTTIGRANNDGTGINQNFIGGASTPSAVAVDAAHVYWLNDDDHSIGRANLDGTGVNQRFLTGVNAGTLAVDGAHIYWTDVVAQDRIGRANLDGTGVDQNFITGASLPSGVAADRVHVYWTNSNTHAIGRANLDGTGVDQNFIDVGLNRRPVGLAVDAAHLYWADITADTIGRANLDGTGVNPDFVPTGPLPFGVAVDSAHIYWTNQFPSPDGLSGGTIGRANLDGTGVTQTFLAGLADPLGVAVDAATRADTVAPTATVTVAAYQTALTNRTVSWSATDPAPSGGGPFLFDVQRKLGINSFGPFGIFVSGTTATSSTFSGAEGETRCFRARARDGAGNTGTYGTARCTGFPTDDAHATAVGFTHQSGLGGSYYLGTRSVSNGLIGSRLTTASFTNVKRVGLVYDAQPGGADVTIRMNGITACTVHTANATLLHRRVASCPPFASAQTGQIVARQATAGPLRIDGIGHRLQ
jgi:hypothetical protein